MASELMLRNGFPGHFWCESCDATRPIRLQDLAGLDVTEKFMGGDIICVACESIIATYGFPIQAEAADALSPREEQVLDRQDQN